MKKYKYLLCILLFMICPNFVNAQTCSNSEKVKYQEMAKNIDISYDYIIENSVARFTIKFDNIQSGLKIKDVVHRNYYEYNSNQLVLNGFIQGYSYRFDVYASNCNDEFVFSHYVTLPYYNGYYGTQLCEGIEEFKYCQKWVKTITTAEEFERQVEKYKKEKYATSEIIEEEQKTIIQIIQEFYLDYYYIILPLIIIACTIIIVKKDKKESLF